MPPIDLPSFPIMISWQPTRRHRKVYCSTTFVGCIDFSHGTKKFFIVYARRGYVDSVCGHRNRTKADVQTRRWCAPQPRAYRGKNRRSRACDKNPPRRCQAVRNPRSPTPKGVLLPQTDLRRCRFSEWYFPLKNGGNILRPSKPPNGYLKNYKTSPNRACSSSPRNLQTGIGKRNWCNRRRARRNYNTRDCVKTPTYGHTPPPLLDCIPLFSYSKICVLHKKRSFFRLKFDRRSVIISFVEVKVCGITL